MKSTPEIIAPLPKSDGSRVSHEVLVTLIVLRLAQVSGLQAMNDGEKLPPGIPLKQRFR